MTTHTGTLRRNETPGGTIELDDAPDLPDGRRVRVTVEPAEAAAAEGDSAPLPADPRPGIEQVAGRYAAYGDELDALVEETYRLRRLTREEARRLRGEP